MERQFSRRLFIMLFMCHVGGCLCGLVCRTHHMHKSNKMIPYILCRAWPGKYLIEMVILHLSGTVFALEIWSHFHSFIHVRHLQASHKKRAFISIRMPKQKTQAIFGRAMAITCLGVCVCVCLSHFYKYCIIWWPRFYFCEFHLLLLELIVITKFKWNGSSYCKSVAHVSAHLFVCHCAQSYAIQLHRITAGKKCFDSWFIQTIDAIAQSNLTMKSRRMQFLLTQWNFNAPFW